MQMNVFKVSTALVSKKGRRKVLCCHFVIFYDEGHRLFTAVAVLQLDMNRNGNEGDKILKFL